MERRVVSEGGLWSENGLSGAALGSKGKGPSCKAGEVVVFRSSKVTLFTGFLGFDPGSFGNGFVDCGSRSGGPSSIFAFFSNASSMEGFNPDIISCLASSISSFDICASF